MRPDPFSFAQLAETPHRHTSAHALHQPLGRRHRPNTAWSVWVGATCGDGGQAHLQPFLFLRHTDVQSNVWATPRQGLRTAAPDLKLIWISILLNE